MHAVYVQLCNLLANCCMEFYGTQIHAMHLILFTLLIFRHDQGMFQGLAMCSLITKQNHSLLQYDDDDDDDDVAIFKEVITI